MNFDFQYRTVNLYVKLNFRINLSTGFFFSSTSLKVRHSNYSNLQQQKIEENKKASR